MRIVVLDGYCLNPGDLSWSGLERLGEVTVYDRTPESLLLERARGAEALLTNKTPLGRETLAALPELRYVGVLATGYNVVDAAAARERGIVVTNVPAYGTASVAQLTIALLLELCHQVGVHAAAVRTGEWAASQALARSSSAAGSMAYQGSRMRRRTSRAARIRAQRPTAAAASQRGVGASKSPSAPAISNRAVRTRRRGRR